MHVPSRVIRPQSSRLECLANATLPTRHGNFDTYVFTDEHLALVHGEVRGHEDVLVRVHSECMTSEVFGSLKCDCKEQLEAALAGPQLSPVDDAIERLSLYVGPGAPVDEVAVGVCVARIRTADTWALVDAVGTRDLGRALRTLADAYDPRERGLPLLGALAWSVRQLARYQAAMAAGASAQDAARQAGAFQPSRARELSMKARAVTAREVERWILVLAETDLALKSSRRSPDVVLEEMLTRLCRAEASAGGGSNATRAPRLHRTA